MTKIQPSPLLLVPALFAPLFFGGCALPLWPSLQTDPNLPNPPKANSIADIESKCLENQQQAKYCALNTIAELSVMLEGVGQFKRGAAYALVATGTAVGGAIAFDASRDLLMGLALGAASILGLDTVVNSDGQRAVLKAGRDATQCVYNATIQIKEKADELGTKVASLRSPFSTASFQSQTFNTVGLQRSVSIPQIDHAFAIAGEGIRDAGDDPAQYQLGPAVIRIRALVRDGLYDTIPALGELAQTQRTTVDTMIQNFARQSEGKVDAAKQVLRDNQLSLVNASTFRSDLDENLNNLFALRSIEDESADTLETAIQELRDIINEKCKS
jgi:hypothetical protein